MSRYGTLHPQTHALTYRLFKKKINNTLCNSLLQIKGEACLDPTTFVAFLISTFMVTHGFPASGLLILYTL